MRNTKIETFTDSWNPVHGCLNGCRYCFAAGIARRFGGHHDLAYYMAQEKDCETGAFHVLDKPMRDVVTNAAEAYPFGFDPTYCRFRLKAPSEIRRPGNILLCSMGDVMAPCVPDWCLDEIWQAAMETPRHVYCFLTKNPKRYNDRPAPPPNFFFGASVDTQQRLMETLDAQVKSLHFLSIEPLLESIVLEKYLREAPEKLEWVIVGPESGNAAGKVTVQREWVHHIKEVCDEFGIPLFMKSGTKTKQGSTAMRELMGDEFVQQFPPLLLKNIGNNTRSATGAQVNGGNYHD